MEHNRQGKDSWTDVAAQCIEISRRELGARKAREGKKERWRRKTRYRKSQGIKMLLKPDD